MANTPYTYALTSLARVKNRLGIDTSVIGNDQSLCELVNSVTDFIENRCNRRFKSTDYTNEVYSGSNADGTPRGYLILRNAPLGTVTTGSYTGPGVSSYQYRSGVKSNPNWTDFQVDTYQETANGIVYRSLPPGFQNIRVSYTAGYLIDFANEFDQTKHTLPADLSDLADRLITKSFKRRLSEGRKSESLNGATVTWDDFLKDQDLEVLANYNRFIYA